MASGIWVDFDGRQVTLPRLLLRALFLLSAMGFWDDRRGMP
jgi:hypothetical protein